MEINTKAFERCAVYHNVFCHWDYAEFVVASFSRQIQSEYYGGNISFSIEVIALEHLSD